MKRMMAVASFSFLLLLGCCISVAQAPSTSPVRDPQAIAAVEQALAALGGKNANRQVRTTVIRGSLQVEGEPTTSSFLWEDDLSGKLPEFRKEIRSASTLQRFVSGHGAPAHENNGEIKALSPHLGITISPFYLPGVVLARELDNPDYSFQLVKDSSGFIHVRTVWELNPGTASITPQDWFFDAATRLPVRVQYLMASNHKLGRPRPATWELSDFHNASGIAVPFRVVSQGSASKNQTMTITDVEVNGAAIDQRRFELLGSQQ